LQGISVWFAWINPCLEEKIETHWVCCHEKDESPQVEKTTGLEKYIRQKFMSHPIGVHPLS